MCHIHSEWHQVSFQLGWQRFTIAAQHPFCPCTSFSYHRMTTLTVNIGLVESPFQHTCLKHCKTVWWMAISTWQNTHSLNIFTQELRSSERKVKIFKVWIRDCLQRCHRQMPGGGLQYKLIHGCSHGLGRFVGHFATCVVFIRNDTKLAFSLVDNDLLSLHSILSVLALPFLTIKRPH
jgi:hypothetical protein